MTRIGLIGSPLTSGLARGISSARPEHWKLVEAISSYPGAIDLLVICEADATKVARALEMWPRAAILAVLPMEGYEGDVAAVFDAGAEAVARTPHTRIVIGHLQTLERRARMLTHVV